MNNKYKVLIIILLVSLVLSSCSFVEELNQWLEILDDSSIAMVEGNMTVHFIDVGQGDSILIQSPSGQNMLIDAGDNNKGDTVVEYLKSQGVDKIDFLVATHPHSDHIGGMDNVIDNFDIGKIHMPKVVHTAKTYEDVLKAIQRKSLKITATHSGMDIPLEGAKVEVLAPDKELKSDNLNDYSIVIKVTYGGNAFLFQGDAEKRTEEEILKAEGDIKADVIKLGHHGSSSSNIQSYIDAVNPTYAVITCGEDNKYGHPHEEIMSLMEEKKISTYRTDIDGDIVIISDGEHISLAK